MSIKKILIIGIVLSLIAISVASAATIEDQIDKILTDEGYKVGDVAKNVSDFDFIKTYNKNSDEVLVGYEPGYTISLDDFEPGFEDKTIGNTQGIYKENSTGYYFHFNHGNDAILIKAPDKAIIEKLATIGN